MPNPSELARQDQEKRPLPKAETFDITIDFGPHQAKLSVKGDNAIEVIDEAYREMKPHIEAMLEAEERNHD